MRRTLVMAEVIQVGNEDDPWIASFARPLSGLPGWVAAIHFVRPADRVECAEVTLAYVEADSVTGLEDWLQAHHENCPPASSVPPGGVTARMVRTMGVGEFQTEARARMTKLEALGALLPSEWSDSAKRPGPKPSLSDYYYADLARRFDELRQAWEKDPTLPDPAAALAKEQFKNVSTMRNRLGAARRKRFLTTAGRGRVGGEMTALAQRVLDSHKEN